MIMVSRHQPLVPSLIFLAANHQHGVVAAASSSYPRRRLGTSSSSSSSSVVTRRAATTDPLSTSSSSGDNSDDAAPHLADTRHSKRSLTFEISQQCLNTLAASANSNGQIKKENYFVFTDGMSNGYYTFNEMTSYTDLPYQNKFGFVTLSCQCRQRGGLSDCCQGNRAHLDVSDMVNNVDSPEEMEEGTQAYIRDICKTTVDSIGENVLPPTGELPATASPTTVAPTGAPTKKKELTSAPTVKPSSNVGSSNVPSASPSSIVAATDPDRGGGTDEGGGEVLSDGARVGIAIGGFFFLLWFLTMSLYIRRKKEEKEKEKEEDADHVLLEEDDGNIKSINDDGKESSFKQVDRNEIMQAMANELAEFQDDVPPLPDPHDVRSQDMTASSDVSLDVTDYSTDVGQSFSL